MFNFIAGIVLGIFIGGGWAYIYLNVTGKFK